MRCALHATRYTLLQNHIDDLLNPIMRKTLAFQCLNKALFSILFQSYYLQQNVKLATCQLLR